MSLNQQSSSQGGSPDGVRSGGVMDPQPNIERMSLLSKSEITMGVVQKYFAMTDGEKSEYRNFLNLPSSFPDGYMDPEVIKVCKELVEFQSEHREELQLGEPPESDPPWVNIATRAENPGHWGFIGYRGFQSSDKEWDAVRDKFERLARSALEKDAFGLPTHDPNGVRFGATIEWQQGVFKGPKDARTHFQNIREGREAGEVPRNALNKAIVTYACILIDDESAESIRSTTSDALNSVDPDMDTESFVWVVDGQWPDEDNGYEPDYRGLYRVRLKHLFDAFYHSVFDYSAMEEMDPERDGGEEKFWQYEAM